MNGKSYELTIMLRPYSYDDLHYRVRGAYDSIPDEWRKAHPGVMLAGPLEMDVEFHFALPGATHDTLKTDRPDTDNLCRGFINILTRVAYYDDDAIAVLRASKWNSSQDYIKVTITELGR